MKRYSVLVPFTGCVEVEVEANDKEEAKRLGYEKACEEIESADTLWDNISEWDFCEIIIEGNVFNGIQNETEAMEIYSKEVSQ
jgi:hypothetical protein